MSERESKPMTDQTKLPDDVERALDSLVCHGYQDKSHHEKWAAVLRAHIAHLNRTIAAMAVRLEEKHNYVSIPVPCTPHLNMPSCANGDIIDHYMKLTEEVPK